MIEDNIKKLIKILEDSKIDELEVSTFWGKQKIKISKRSNFSVDKSVEIIHSDLNENISNKDDDSTFTSKNPLFSDNDVTLENNPPKLNIKKTTINAPLVGTYYQSSKPSDPPFINIGDKIKEGQVICIIEAMKIFNEIESEVSGTITEILIKDGTPVEYDQALMTVSSD